MRPVWLRSEARGACAPAGLENVTALESGNRTSKCGQTGLEVWLVDLLASSEALEVIELGTPRLAPSDLAAHSTTEVDSPRGARRTTHIALRILIERLLGPHWRGVAFATGPSGKPSLPLPMSPEIGRGSFSLSHSSGHALVAVTKGRPVGVDLEEKRPLAMSPERRKRILEAGRRLAPDGSLPGESEAAVLQAWVRLEAFAKVDGRGIGRVLTSMGVMGGARSAKGAIAGMVTRSAIGMPMQVAPFAVRDIEVGEGLFAAIALEGWSGPVDVLHFPCRRAEIEALLV